ncbi:MAG: hypothetical protein ACQEXJ_09715 [Myxococcota bacterium]
MRARLFAAALLASLATPAVAGAATYPFEIALSPETHVATSDSLTPLSDTGSHVSGTLRAGYAVLEFLDLYAGYRSIGPFERLDADGVDWSTEFHAAILGARLRWPLKGDWLRLYGQLDVEASKATVEVAAGSGTGRQSVWSAGAVPSAGVEFSFTIRDAVRLLGRLGLGYALRLDHDFDAVGFDTAAPTQRPVDLGAANFSGLHVGLTLGVRF